MLFGTCIISYIQLYYIRLYDVPIRNRTYKYMLTRYLIYIGLTKGTYNLVTGFMSMTPYDMVSYIPSISLPCGTVFNIYYLIRDIMGLLLVSALRA